MILASNIPVRRTVHRTHHAAMRSSLGIAVLESCDGVKDRGRDKRLWGKCADTSAFRLFIGTMNKQGWYERGDKALPL